MMAYVGLLLCGRALQESLPPEAPAPEAPARMVGAIVYPWYDWPDGHFVGADGRDLLRHHLLNPELAHPDSSEWWERELGSAAEAGLDLLLVANVPLAKSGKEWRPALRGAWSRTKGKLARPIRLAPLIDPFFVASERSDDPQRIPKLDLNDPLQFAALIAPIDAFARALPKESWARMQGRPLVVIGDVGAVGTRPDDVILQVQAAAKEALGEEPWLLVEKTWKEPAFPQWREGAALLGPQLLHGTETGAATLGPGFDDSLLPRGRGLLRLREEGANYSAAWQTVLASGAPLAIVESWNQLHDGTAIAPALETGRTYVDLTRRFADLFRSGATDAPDVAGSSPPARRFPLPVAASSFAPDRELVWCDQGLYVPGRESGGLRLTSRQDAQIEFVLDAAGVQRLLARPPPGRREGELRFEVSDVLPTSGDTAWSCLVTAAASGEPVDLSIESSVLVAGPGDPHSWKQQSAARRTLLPRETTTITAALDRQQLRSSANGDLFLRFRGEALFVDRIELQRLGVPDRAGRIGVAGPGSGSAGGRLAQVGVTRLRSTIDWARIEPRAGERDERALAELLARPQGFDGVLWPTLVDPPQWASPLRAHPAALADFVRAYAARYDGVLELFPGANRPGVLGDVPDPQGYVEAFQAAAAAAHEVNPRLALVLGGIVGPDVEWLQTIQELRAPFAYDALSFVVDDAYGLPGTRTFDGALARMVHVRDRSFDATKPFVVELGVDARPSPLLARPQAALLPALIAVAQSRTAKAGGPIRVLDEPELPLVHGARGSIVVELLRTAGLAATTASVAELVRLLEEGTEGPRKTILLPQGEILPLELVAPLPAFIDQGGLVVCTGGLPFRRPATRMAAGGWQLEVDRSAMEKLWDDLRINWADFRPDLARRELPIDWRAGPAFAELADFAGPGPADTWLFARRTGRPRSEKGFHRYSPLLTAFDGERPLGDVATLLQFQAGREGALLLIGIEGGGARVDPEQVAGHLTAGFDAALAAGAHVVFWRGPIDAADGTEQPAAAALRAIAARERGARPPDDDDQK